MTSISIILLDYNSHELTHETLLSLNKVNFKNMDIHTVVVDNASEEPLEIDTSQYPHLNVELLRSKKNKGFTGGNNKGIFYAWHHYKPDYIMLLNNDTEVDAQFLQELLKLAESKEKMGMVCPLIYFAKGYEYHKNSYTKDELGNVIWFAGGSIDWQNMYAFHRNVDEVDRGQIQVASDTLSASALPSSKFTKGYSKAMADKKVKSGKGNEIPLYNQETMDFGTGCCMLIPMSILDKVGLFDESYFLYWEDVDLSQRIRKAGYNIYLAPEAKIWHKNGGSTGGSGSEFHQYYQERNRLKFALHYAPLRTKLAVLREQMT